MEIMARETELAFKMICLIADQWQNSEVIKDKFNEYFIHKVNYACESYKFI